MAARVLRFLDWADYIAPACLQRFETETGIRVEEVCVDSNDEFVARLRAGEPCDVAMPSDWAAQILSREGLLVPLDMDRIPNWRHVTQEYFQAPPYDPGTDGNKYTSVCMFGAEGFAVRIDKIASPRRSWDMLFDPAFAGQICMMDGSREVLAVALLLAGGDPNTTDAAMLEAATELALRQSELVVAYDSGAVWHRIIGGLWLVHCWEGDIAKAISAGCHQVVFILPREGFCLWADAPCVPAAAADPEAAHRFLDFLLEPEIAALNADFAGYQPVAPVAAPLIKSLVQRSMRPTDEQMAQGTFLHDLGDFNVAYEEAYAKVRAGGASQVVHMARSDRGAHGT